MKSSNIPLSDKTVQNIYIKLTIDPTANPKNKEIEKSTYANIGSDNFIVNLIIEYVFHLVYHVLSQEYDFKFLNPL